MLEARLDSDDTLKKIVDSLQVLVTEANLDCNDMGMSLQCMDSGHVALVLLQLRAEGFSEYRCDRGLPLGLKFDSLGKVLRCAGSGDSVTLRADDGGDSLNLTFESSSKFPNQCLVSPIDSGRLAAIDSDLYRGRPCFRV